MAGLPGAPGVGHDGLGGLEVPDGDQRLVGEGLGPDPLPGVVPAHPGLIAAGDVVDVEQDLVFALLVPDLPAGVPGLRKMARTALLAHPFPTTVRVAGRVVLGWGGAGRG